MRDHEIDKLIEKFTQIKSDVKYKAEEEDKLLASEDLTITLSGPARLMLVGLLAKLVHRSVPEVPKDVSDIEPKSLEALTKTLKGGVPFIEMATTLLEIIHSSTSSDTPLEFKPTKSEWDERFKNMIMAHTASTAIHLGLDVKEVLRHAQNIFDRAENTSEDTFFVSASGGELN